MNDAEKKVIIDTIDKEYDAEVKKKVLTDAKLQFKALIFLQHQVCRSCRFKILNSVRSGQKFNPELLCPVCKNKYELLRGGK